MADESMAQRFTEALGALEDARDLEPILALYGDGAETGNAVTDHAFSGVEGAREFWEEYRSLFDDVHSTYRAQLDTDGVAVLEWSTEGTASASGEAIAYDGVTMIEHANDAITRLRAYFDSRHLDVGP